MDLFSSEAFFQTENRMILSFLRQSPSVLEAIPSLATYIEKIIKPEILGEVEDGAWVETGRVRLEPGAKIERGAIVRGPTIIGKDTVVRSGAYIRGHLLTGKGCLIGHGTEIRQILLMDESNLPHLNCIFTSIIGSRVNIAGNTHTANMLINRREVEIRVKMNGQSQTFPTGQTWFGSIIGDDSSIGALSLLQPGTVIGQRCLIYPQCSVSGYIHSDSMVRPTFAPFEVVPR